MNHIPTFEEFLNEARRPGTGEIAVMKADRSKAEKIMKSMNLAYVDAGDNHGRAKLHWYEIPDADMDLLNKIGDAVDIQIMRVNENESEINEAKMTWFPKAISVLKDIYIGKNSVWTSIAGSIAGITEITIGVKTGDTAKIITGVGLLLLGLFSKEK
jgi:hypothetical protein